MTQSNLMPKTLFEKIWDSHVVTEQPASPAIIYIDLHLVHEVTSPQAFDALRMAGRKVRRPDLTLATMDHNVPTTDRSLPITDEIARRQMSGFGGVVSFEVKGALEDASRFVDAMRIPYILPSLGGVDSLVEQPALMSYFEKTTEERLELGIKDNLVRFAVGIEDAADLVADLEQALRA